MARSDCATFWLKANLSQLSDLSPIKSHLWLCDIDHLTCITCGIYHLWHLSPTMVCYDIDHQYYLLRIIIDQHWYSLFYYHQMSQVINVGWLQSYQSFISDLYLRAQKMSDFHLHPNLTARWFSLSIVLYMAFDVKLTCIYESVYWEAILQKIPEFYEILS